MSDERLDFKSSVLAADGGCVMEGVSPCEGDVQAHHVVTQQQLRARYMDGLLWEPANGAAVCERHHRRHHNRREPIRVAVLPARVLGFVAENDLGYYLDRYYDSQS